MKNKKERFASVGGILILTIAILNCILGEV